MRRHRRRPQRSQCSWRQSGGRSCIHPARSADHTSSLSGSDLNIKLRRRVTCGSPTCEHSPYPAPSMFIAAKWRLMVDPGGPRIRTPQSRLSAYPLVKPPASSPPHPPFAQLTTCIHVRYLRHPGRSYDHGVDGCGALTWSIPSSCSTPRGSVSTCKHKAISERRRPLRSRCG